MKSEEERIAELEKLVKELLEKNAELQKVVEEWKRGFRQRGKRFSSRSEVRRPAVARKTPGRKRGHKGAFREVPSVVDEVIEYSVPAACLCGGDVLSSDKMERVVEEEIPSPRLIRTAHCAKVGTCMRCGKRVIASIPGASPNGQQLSEVVLGPRAQALALSIRFEHHVSYRSTSRLLKRGFGLSVTAGALSQLSTRLSTRTAPGKEEIRAHVQNAPVVGADETGFRQSGAGGWVWVFRTPEASLFEVSPSRGGAVFEQAIGRIDGVVVSDYYGVYTARKDLLHAYCGAHLIREAKEIAELNPTPLTLEFSTKLVALYKKGEAATTHAECESVRNTFRWLTVARRFKKHRELARLTKRIADRFEGVVAFLGRKDIPWTNNATERDIRPLAIHRKVVGSTRSEDGSNALGHWMSVTQTLRKNGSHLAEWLPEAMNTWRKNELLPSLFRASA